MIKKYNMPFCMDVCHLNMGEVAFGFKAKEILLQLKGQMRHMHIADASGIDGEGVLFGEGDSKNLETIRAALKMDCVKVIEVWQGHLHGGVGFAGALNDLMELFDV